MAGAVAGAIALGFLMLAIVYIIAPNQKPSNMPVGTPVPLWLQQLVDAAIWIGVTIAIAIAIIGLFLLINRVRPKKRETALEIQVLNTEFCRVVERQPVWYFFRTL